MPGHIDEIECFQQKETASEKVTLIILTITVCVLCTVTQSS